MQYEIKGYPAVWGKGEVTELLVAGASDKSGVSWAGTSKDTSGLPSVYASGVKITCADALGAHALRSAIRPSTGTSDGKLVPI